MMPVLWHTKLSFISVSACFESSHFVSIKEKTLPDLLLFPASFEFMSKDTPSKTKIFGSLAFAD